MPTSYLCTRPIVLQVPTAGGVFITLYARNLGHMAPRTTLSVIFRGEVLDTPVSPNTEWILQTSTVVEMQATVPPRESVASITYTNETDGIRYVTKLSVLCTTLCCLVSPSIWFRVCVLGHAAGTNVWRLC